MVVLMMMQLARQSSGAVTTAAVPTISVVTADGVDDI